MLRARYLCFKPSSLQCNTFNTPLHYETENKISVACTSGKDKFSYSLGSRVSKVTFLPEMAVAHVAQQETLHKETDNNAEGTCGVALLAAQRWMYQLFRFFHCHPCH